MGGNLQGEPALCLPGPAADSPCRRTRPPAGRQEKTEQRQVGESPTQEARRSRSAIAGGLLGRHVSVQERHGLIEREEFDILAPRLAGQTVLELLQRQFHCLAR